MEFVFNNDANYGICIQLVQSLPCSQAIMPQLKSYLWAISPLVLHSSSRLSPCQWSKCIWLLRKLNMLIVLSHSEGAPLLLEIFSCKKGWMSSVCTSWFRPSVCWSIRATLIASYHLAAHGKVYVEPCTPWITLSSAGRRVYLLVRYPQNGCLVAFRLVILNSIT